MSDTTDVTMRAATEEEIDASRSHIAAINERHAEEIRLSRELAEKMSDHHKARLASRFVGVETAKKTT